MKLPITFNTACSNQFLIYCFQRMLLTALLIQVTISVISLILPIALCLIFCVTGFKWTSTFTIFAFVFMSLHAIIEFTSTIISIKPYRIFVRNLTMGILIRFKLIKPPRHRAVSIMVTRFTINMRY